MHRNGRFASVTNFRDAVPAAGKLRSRGHLVTEFLHSELSPTEYLGQLDGDQYAGFNLLVAGDGELAYLSNRGGGLQALSPGIYGVANASLDAPWSKVIRSKAALNSLIDSGRANETNLLSMLNDREKAAVAEVETGHLSFKKAHAMTAPFIVQPDYGTRCSSVLLQDAAGRVRFTEMRFDADGNTTGRSDFSFDICA